MVPGDMVRFAKFEEIIDINGDWTSTPKEHVGLLINYDKLMKTASVLYANEVINVRAQLVEKAGRREFGKV